MKKIEKWNQHPYFVVVYAVISEIAERDVTVTTKLEK